jgi:hypothetical protein
MGQHGQRLNTGTCFSVFGLKKCRILITVLTLPNRPSIVIKEGGWGLSWHSCLFCHIPSYRMRRGRTDEQRYAIISPYFDGRIKMNGPYPEITNISFLAKLFFKIFQSNSYKYVYRLIAPLPWQVY